MNSINMPSTLVATLSALVVSIAASAALHAAPPVTYEDFGAVGDGKADDLSAIVAAHEAANKRGVPVCAGAGKTYYIGSGTNTAIVMTDVDFGTAKFIIDDRKVAVDKRMTPVFRIVPSAKPIAVGEIKTLAKGQTRLDAKLPGPCLVEVEDNTVRQYIRYGANRNKGFPKREVFLVDATGTIDPRTPVVWDYTNITRMTARPVDQKPLVVRGGRFMTVANQAESRCTYYSRGITVARSNVLIEGLRHEVTGEGDHGAPYYGFIAITRCANVTASNCVFTAHRTYGTTGASGRPVKIGSYDVTAHAAAIVSLINCRQTTDISDARYWGIFASNYCKNLLYDGCVFSRFDAHMGVANAAIRNSTLGYMGINAIGFGTFIVENTTVRSGSFFNLRGDYGSTWDGEFIVRNCKFSPSRAGKSAVALVNGSSTDWHDFGYICHMPRRIVFDGLEINDAKDSGEDGGLFVFGQFSKRNTGPGYVAKHPYHVTEEVVLRNVKTTSGRTVELSPNAWMFRKVKIARE